jgi:hypothetical protein
MSPQKLISIAVVIVLVMLILSTFVPTDSANQPANPTPAEQPTTTSGEQIKLPDFEAMWQELPEGFRNFPWLTVLASVLWFMVFCFPGIKIGQDADGKPTYFGMYQYLIETGVPFQMDVPIRGTAVAGGWRIEKIIATGFFRKSKLADAQAAGKKLGRERQEAYLVDRLQPMLSKAASQIPLYVVAEDKKVNNIDPALRRAAESWTASDIGWEELPTGLVLQHVAIQTIVLTEEAQSILVASEAGAQHGQQTSAEIAALKSAGHDVDANKVVQAAALRDGLRSLGDVLNLFGGRGGE